MESKALKRHLELLRGAYLSPLMSSSGKDVSIDVCIVNEVIVGCSFFSTPFLCLNHDFLSIYIWCIDYARKMTGRSTKLAARRIGMQSAARSSLVYLCLRSHTETSMNCWTSMQGKQTADAY